ECADTGGVGEPCGSDADCAFNAYGTVCVLEPGGTETTCQVPCDADSTAPGAAADHTICAPGETCRLAAATVDLTRRHYYCDPTAFRVDINLVDQCVAQFLQGLTPALGSGNACSLERNLSRLLD